MRFALTNYGHRYLQHLDRSGRLDDLQGDDDVRVLARILAHGPEPEGASPRIASLRERGYVEPVDDDADAAAIELGYARNPLEHLRRVVFEYTTVCNLDCLHCRNTAIDAHAEASPERLRRVVDAALPIGLDRFDFIGGEVTLYGKGWLELVEYIRAEGGSHAAVLTSGWFLGERTFSAAGKRYLDARAYLDELCARGLTHVVFSLDGPEPVHDACRQTPGLYRRVLDGIELVRAAGMTPRVSIVTGLGTSGLSAIPWMADLSRRLYGPEPNDNLAAVRLLGDDSNYASNFIDVGAGVKLRRSREDLAAWSDEQLRCKNFFRPSPTLRIKATGEISLCPLVEGGDGYGNVHERDVVELLNRMQDAVVYKLHAERKIGEARRFLDPDIFGGRIGHACSVRVAINMIALAMHDRAVAPDDREAIRAINVEVAEKMGVLPRSAPNRANGHARPR
jgi:hypothetical protein